MGTVREPDEEARWREIVDNYGDRPDLADEDLPSSAATWPASLPAEDPEPLVDDEDDEDRFVPDEPPPIPRPEPPRLVAWAGVFGAPLLLLAAVIFGLGYPVLVTYALVGWFVGGFAYLVTAMPRGPRDPGDDGAVL